MCGSSRGDTKSSASPLDILRRKMLEADEISRNRSCYRNDDEVTKKLGQVIAD